MVETLLRELPNQYEIMEEIIMDNNELNLNEMEQAAGGAGKERAGGMKDKPAEKPGCIIYKIVPGDKLGQIARNHGTTVERIMSVNPSIKNANLIRAGYYIYIPR